MSNVAGVRDIPLYRVHTPPGLGSLLTEVFDSGQLASGEYVNAFEDRLRAFIGNPRLTATGAEASSIALALFMAGVRPGDEVLACPMSCLSSNMPVLNLFARVVWCDIDPATATIDLRDAAKRLTERTKAVLISHWVGYPSDLTAIGDFANQHGLKVVDNAGEALGASFGGRKLGNTTSDFTIFSFYANRHVTTVDGAAIAFRSTEDFERARWLRRFGIHQPTFRDELGEISRDSDIPVPGISNFMSNVAAAVGLAQMEYLEAIISRHQSNGRYYDAALRDVAGITPLTPTASAEPSPWVYSFHAEGRDDLLRMLRSKGVAASRVHLRNDTYSCFGGLTEAPGLDYFAKHNLCVPCGWWVSDDDREYVADCIRAGW